VHPAHVSACDFPPPLAARTTAPARQGPLNQTRAVIGTARQHSPRRRTR
jgi:hypothetical protein